MKLPEKTFLSEQDREQISDWVLKQASNYEDVSECLDKRTCDKCGQKIWDAALTCYSC